MAPKRKRSSSGEAYQVFLSFRGPDTRQGFTDVLYHALIDHGISVFQDDEEIRKGEDIGDEILRAIQDSRIFVPVFSRNYASSKWCMIELAKMFESKESSTSSSSNKKKILPIFYDVTIDDVKLKTELYKGALSVHSQTFGPEIVRQWEMALLKAGKIKGWELKNTGYSEFSKSFASEVSIMVKVKHKSVSEFFLPREYQELLKRLEVEASGVRCLGIHGMGGIGKTTLAKVVYNKLCDGFCHSVFLSDVRESSLQHKGIENLQNKLLAGLGLRPGEIADVGDGIRRIKQLGVEKKVLIVLDDVDHVKQIQSLVGDTGWFGSGSRIIITSRNKDVLKKPGFDIHEVKELKPEESLRLFSMHAFGHDSPLPDYLSLSKKAVASTGGLPLALEVLGSYLRNKKHKHWETAIQRLEKVPHQDVQEKLMISYDALHPKTRQIFLDIACFFINCDKRNPIYMWEACDFDPYMRVKELVHLSLIKVTKEKDSWGEIKENLWMHDQLRDLGRMIVADESFKDVIKWSRLWMPNDAFKSLENMEDDEDHIGHIEMMRVPSYYFRPPRTYSINEILRFRKLRYLECNGATVSGDERLLLPKLLWLSWQSCPHNFIRTTLLFNNLVILDLSHSSISETWGGWSHIQIGNKLKVLDLSHCGNLTKTPDFSKYSSLERLILGYCTNLTDLDPSICKLQCLKFLNVQACRSLRGFPEELCSLDSLEVILGGDIGENKRFFNMPKSFGNIRSLSIFTLLYFRIMKLPESMHMLVRLRHFSLRGCSGLQGVPDFLGDMILIVELNLSETDVVALPQAIGRLEKLEILNLNWCKELKMLPDSIGQLRRLTKLDLSYSGITELPETMGKLQELRVLRLIGIKIRELPRSIGMLKSLEELYASDCPLVAEIPSKINELPHLRILDVRSTGVTRLPPKLPTTLTKLRASSSSWQSFKLKGIGKCHGLVELELQLNISSIYKGLSSLSQLQRLSLRCSHLQTSPPLPSSCSFLCLYELNERMALPRLSNLKNLSGLEFRDCYMEDDKIFGNMGIRVLESLRKIKFMSCSFRNLNVFFMPKCLAELEIMLCQLLETVYGLSHLKSLTMLSFVLCNKLVGIPEVGELDSLQSLHVWSCDSVDRIPNLIKLRNLTRIEIRYCKEFKGIENINELGSVRKCIISNCNCQ